MNDMANARKIALNALLELRKSSSYSNITLNNTFKDIDITPSDKALATAIFYGVLDRTITIDYVLSRFIKTPLKKVAPLSLEAMRCAVYQIMFMDKIPDSAAVNEAVKLVKASKERFNASFVNGVLRNILRNNFELPSTNGVYDISVRYSCPEWIVESFINDYGIDNTISLLDFSLQSPPVILRTNTLKTDREELIALLQKENIEAEKCSPHNAVKIMGGIDVAANKYFKQGLFHIQDLASQTAVSKLSVKPNERVLDMCAAPGGKTFTIAENMENTGEIIACDIYEKRVNLIRKGAKRLGLDIIKPQVVDASIFNDKIGLFDAILCDVPCSGLGVIRRKPEIKYKNLDEYEDITKLQFAILCNADKYLKTAGRILYSTCTLRACENEALVKSFINNNSNYKLIYEHTFMPHIDGTDGFYCALLEKSR